MSISPKRRRRALHAHRLREAGCSLREIAAELDTSHTTVHQDLKLLETHWAEFAQALANDSLLEHHCRLRDRLEQLYAQHPLDTVHGFHDGMALIEFRPAQIVQLVALHKREIIAAMREYRHSINDLRNAAETQRDAPQPVPDYPDAELTPDLPEQTQPNPTEINHPNQPPEPILIPVFTSPLPNSNTDAPQEDLPQAEEPHPTPSSIFSPQRGEMPQAEGGRAAAPQHPSPSQETPPQAEEPQPTASPMFSPQRGELPQAEGGSPTLEHDLPAFPTHEELTTMDIPQLAQYFQLLKAAAG